MLYVDVKFAGQIGARLRNFRAKSQYLWNFSCPICGDSKTNKLKARGFIYHVKGSLFVKCHNCAYSSNLGNFIEQIDPVLHQEYVMEKYKGGVLGRSGSIESKDPGIPELFRPELSDAILDPIQRLDMLSPDHPAVKYCLNRSIPKHLLNLFYFAPRFKQYVNSIIPGKFQNVDDEHPRLIIPYFTRHGKCFAFQGRAFGKEDPKYYTIKIDDEAERIYGLDRINFGKHVYIVEGPIDSLFIPNCIAVSGSSFISPTIKALQSHSTLVYDNEPRAPELVKLIKKTIGMGYKVCLWPETIVEKDINAMVQSGKSSSEIVRIINENTFQGAAANLRLVTWRKC